MRKIVIILTIFVLIIGVGDLYFAFFLDKDSNASSEEGTKKGGLFSEPEQAVHLKISCVGDIMAHSTQIKAQYDSTTGQYNFDSNFDYVRSYIESADLALCNVETTFGGGAPSGYPLFCAPDQLAQSIKNAGFDVAITANNHMLDTGVAGLRRTLEILRSNGLYTTGSQYEGEAPYALVEVKGVNVGIIAYTYETSGTASSTTINGIPVSSEAQPFVNSFNYNDLDNDLAKIYQNMDTLRAQGAEILICYFHWGDEYNRTPNQYQISIGQAIADYGADVIFASHPHVLQTVDMLTSQTDGRQVPIFYSAGNFISNQRQETLNDNRYTEQGIIASVNLEYMKSTKAILSKNIEVLPTWVDRYKSGGKNVYSIIPLDSNLSNNATLAASGHLSRAQQALDDVRALIGDQYIVQ